MELSFQTRDWFFDRPKVQAALGKARTKALKKAGAFVRRAARSSMRRRAKVSAPGTPPSAHAGKGLQSLKTILFAYEPSRSTVVIGPVGFNQKNSGVSVPRLHEYGGTVQIQEFRYVVGENRGPWRRVNARTKPKPQSGQKIELRTRAATYPKRPFMQPALQKETPKFADIFKDALAKVG
jgi:hypothetical protein